MYIKNYRSQRGLSFRSEAFLLGITGERVSNTEVSLEPTVSGEPEDLAAIQACGSWPLILRSGKDDLTNAALFISSTNSFSYKFSDRLEL